MEFVSFMRGTAGRALRIIAGLGLAAVGILTVGGLWGTLLAVLGGVMIAAGAFNFCLLAPLFHADLWGKPKRTSH